MTDRLERLGRRARVVSGTGFPDEYQGRGSGDVPYLKVSDLSSYSNRSGFTAAANYVSRADLASLGARIIPAGATIFPKIGAALLKNPRVLTSTECAIDNNLVAIVPREGDARFWRYALSIVDLGEMVASSPLPYVGDSEIRDILLPLPGHGEQQRIADFLDEQLARMQRTIDMLARLKDVLRQRRESVVYFGVTGASYSEQAPSCTVWARSMPAIWREVKLSYVAKMGSGHTPSRSRVDWWQGCTIPWITTGEVQQVREDRSEVIVETREKLSEVGLANSAAELHPRGTVVLCRTASAGYSAIMGRDMATSQDFATWTCSSGLDASYLLWCLRAMRRDLLGRLAYGSTHKTIYVPDLQAIRIPLPPIEEQRDIVSEIRSSNAAVDQAIDATDAQRAFLDERRRALIASAVGGQIDVTTARGVEL